MSPFIVTSLNSNGSVFMLDTDTIDAVNGSQAYTQGFVVGTLDAVDTATDPFMNGARYRADGALRLYDATSALPSQVYYDSGIAFTSSGQMCITQGAVSNAIYISGMAVRTDGAVYATPASFYLPLADAGNGAVDTTAWGKGASQTATFTRATTATTVNSAGLIIPVNANIARSYYDPTILEYRGYLAEGARTNLCLRSDRFDTTWGNSGSSESYIATVGPSGNASSWKLIENSANSTHAFSQSITWANATAYTISVWAKSAERSVIVLQLGSAAFSGTPTAWFDLTGATVSKTSGSPTTTTIQAYPNGWYRCTMTATSTAAAAASFVIYLDESPTGTAIYQGNGTSGAFLFGGQAEAGAFASTYIPTTTASVTRNADVLTYPFSGNASAAVGTAYAEGQVFFATSPAIASLISTLTGGSNTPLQVPSGVAPEQIRLRDGTNLVTKSSLTSFRNNTSKFASSWGGTTALVTAQGLAVQSGTFDGDIGSNSIAIGCDNAGGANFWFGTIRNIRIWQTQFSAAQLQAITSG